MTKTFELFHLSLLQALQGSIWTEPMSREAWLRKAFGETFIFHHRGRPFHWVPAPHKGTEIVGTVARTRKRVHHKPPEEGAIEVIDDEWQGALVLVDPTHHDDGQKMAFEQDVSVGKPWPVLQSLFATVNARQEAPYAIEPKPIWDEATFWGWATAHGNLVRRITFDFVVPNMWGSSSDLDDELKALGDDTNARTAKVTLENPEGVKTDSQHVQDGVDYAARGGGELTARAKNGDKYTSTKRVRKSMLPASPEELAQGLKALTKWFPRLLGRNEDSRPADGDSADSNSAGD